MDDKSKQIKLNLIKKKDQQSICVIDLEEDFYLDKDEHFLISNNVNKDSIELDNSLNSSFDKKKRKDSNRLEDEFNKEMDQPVNQQVEHQFNQNQHEQNKNGNQDINNNQFDSDSNMSISSNDDNLICENLNRCFPTFFNKQKRPIKDKSVKELEINNIQIPGILESVNLELDNNNSLANELVENETTTTNNLKANKPNLCDVDDDESLLDNEEESIAFSDITISDSQLNQTLMQLDNNKDEISSLYQLLKDNQISILDDYLFHNLDDSQINLSATPINEIEFMFDKHASFELNERVFEKIIKLITAKNHISQKAIRNIVAEHLNGASSAFIALYIQHFNFEIRQDIVHKVIRDFNYFNNVLKLKNLKRLVLSKKNRFDQFGQIFLDQCLSYEQIALIFYLYFENTEPTVYLNEELALKLLNNKQRIDSLLFSKIPNHQNSLKVLYESSIKMVAHFLSKNTRLIEFLSTSKDRPTLNVELIDKSTRIKQKFKKYDYQKDINLNHLSPVETLNLISFEELNLIRLKFNCSRIRGDVYKLLTEELFPLAEHEFLSDCFKFMWSFYFDNILKCFYRYEMKVKSKRLLAQDFLLRLKPILLREPILKKTILGIEPCGKCNKI